MRVPYRERRIRGEEKENASAATSIKTKHIRK
jgi:hypothetical protein